MCPYLFSNKFQDVTVVFGVSHKKNGSAIRRIIDLRFYDANRIAIMIVSSFISFTIDSIE